MAESAAETLESSTAELLLSGRKNLLAAQSEGACSERGSSQTTEASSVETSNHEELLSVHDATCPMEAARISAFSHEEQLDSRSGRAASGESQLQGGLPLDRLVALSSSVCDFRENSSNQTFVAPECGSSAPCEPAPRGPAAGSSSSSTATQGRARRDSDPAVSVEGSAEPARAKECGTSVSGAEEPHMPDYTLSGEPIALRKTLHRPRDNWLKGETLGLYMPATGASSPTPSVEAKPSPRASGEAWNGHACATREVPDGEIHSSHEFQEGELLALSPEVLAKHILSLRAHLTDCQKQLVEANVKLVKSELNVKELEQRVQKKLHPEETDASPAKAADAATEEDELAAMQEEVDQLKAQLRIANSTADYLQKALRDRSNREMELKNHIAALTAVNKDMQQQACALTRMQASLTKDKQRAPQDEARSRRSSLATTRLSRLPEDDSLCALPLRRQSWGSSAGASAPDRKVQFDVCPVLGAVHYVPVRTCPVDVALAAFVNQRINKILFTRVRPGLYLYGRMPVRVQLGTDPDTHTKRLEIVARGRRYSISNFINMFEDAEFAILDLAHKKAGGLLPLELSSLPGSLESQPRAYTSAGPGGSATARFGSSLPLAASSHTEQQGRRWLGATSDVSGDTSYRALSRQSPGPRPEEAHEPLPGPQRPLSRSRPGVAVPRLRLQAVAMTAGEVGRASGGAFGLDAKGLQRQVSRYPLSPMRDGSGSSRRRLSVNAQVGCGEETAVPAPRRIASRKPRAAASLSEDAAGGGGCPPGEGRGASRRLKSASTSVGQHGGRAMREADAGLKRSSLSVLEGTGHQGKKTLTAGAAAKKGGASQASMSAVHGDRGAEATETRGKSKSRRLAGGAKLTATSSLKGASADQERALLGSAVTRTGPGGGHQRMPGELARCAKSNSRKAPSATKAGVNAARKTATTQLKTFVPSPQGCRVAGSPVGASVKSCAVQATLATGPSMQRSPIPPTPSRSLVSSQPDSELASPSSSLPADSSQLNVKSAVSSASWQEDAVCPQTSLLYASPASHSDAAAVRRSSSLSRGGVPVVGLPASPTIPAASVTRAAYSKFPPSSPVREKLAHAEKSSKLGSLVVSRCSPHLAARAFQDSVDAPSHTHVGHDPTQQTVRLMQRGLWPIPVSATMSSSSLSPQ
ncbi:hypothetical protein BESB_024260 [Besnoitia besnoiti]|uniref:Uncharacterized protein n=1 Tax=Besnoitia besnoiti TaxID=94643 RepID=A0A2A9M3Y9_BESBE|nr:hypothetical protein BESB_024260 [Besnoitia besnoiti]PFH31934.1 hypothetical protein BESB_024260 [Besnoitia besnoiti]